MELVKFRLKLIRIADKSDCGWKTVNEYVADELAENSEDEKRLYRSEQRGQRKIRKSRQNRIRTAGSSARESYTSQSRPRQVPPTPAEEFFSKAKSRQQRFSQTLLLLWEIRAFSKQMPRQIIWTFVLINTI